ncbi:MAG: aldo/keto reductase [Woeseiaceae bacterium]|nr:aldo/keto reductase [Woeseiaceae bacterium]
MKITRRDFTKSAVGSALLAASPISLAGPEDRIMRAIPSSGEEIPVVGLGTNRYGVDASEAARAPLREALSRFHELGGTVIDTAPMYRTSESVLGDLIAELGIRDDLFVATKVDEEDGRDASDAQMNDSLTKLQTSSFDLMQVHNLSGWQDSLPLMREWRDEGRIRYIGITTSRARQYEDFEAIMRAEELDFIQVNYSLEQQESAERLIPLAADLGMGVMVNRAFGGGRIFDQVGDQPLPDWAAEFDCTSWAQFLLKYVISHPAVTVTIPGMTKARHVDDNIMAMHGRLPDAELRRRMEEFFAGL